VAPGFFPIPPTFRDKVVRAFGTKSEAWLRELPQAYGSQSGKGSQSMDRPYLILQVAASADGRISIAPNRTMFEDMADPRLTTTMVGADLWREVRESINAAHPLQADILGSASLVKEGRTPKPPGSPAPLDRLAGDRGALYQDFLPEEVVGRAGHEGWLVIVDGRGRVRGGFKGTPDAPGWHALHLVSRAAPPEYLAFLRHTGIPYLVSGEKRVDLPAAMGKLRSKLGVENALSTAGGRLNGALLRAGLVDEIHIIVAPVVIGGFETPSLFDSPDLRPGEWPTRLTLLKAGARADGRVWLHYRVGT